MPRIYLCFLWHMHQPFYKDLATGVYRLPWTRLHALKDYYGIVSLLEEFPAMKQTFNLVPSMMIQVAEYASGEATDAYWQVAVKPAEDLTPSEQLFARKALLQLSPRLIARFPRFVVLARQIADGLPLTTPDWRDLQVLSQLAWFEESCFEQDADVRHLAAQGRGYGASDQALLARKQREIINRVIPTYRDFAASGQIEISTTPFYHPILPLVCDSQMAQVSMPDAVLPQRFCYPKDAAWHITSAYRYITRLFGQAPRGMWPSEGSVSDETLRLASDAGFHWVASDNEVLGRTLGTAATPSVTYRPYRWWREGREVRLVFRDHYLSDLIGFTYANSDAEQAAQHFVSELRERARPLLASGQDALIPIILDGENAWEFYDRNGRPFLRALYRRIAQEAQMEPLTISGALQKVEPAPLSRIYPGSWIDANFKIWIGADEDNQAWDLLRRAREAYTQHAESVPETQRAFAWEELMIAEGSDWCWWYGPEHASDNRPDFDQLFRDHLANAYRELNLPVPEALTHSLLRMSASYLRTPAFAAIHPVIDGRLTVDTEWHGAEVARADPRSGAMHGQRVLFQALQVGSNGQDTVYVRLDPLDAKQMQDIDWEARIELAGRAIVIRRQSGQTMVDEPSCQIAHVDIVELAVPFTALGVRPGDRLPGHATIYRSGLPFGVLPEDGPFAFFL